MVHETLVLNRLNAVQQNYQQEKASRRTACSFSYKSEEKERTP